MDCLILTANIQGVLFSCQTALVYVYKVHHLVTGEQQRFASLLRRCHHRCLKYSFCWLVEKF